MTRVFISYSHQDEAWKDRVVRQLGALVDEGLEIWHDQLIQGKDDWQKEIEKAIAWCDVALLLISAQFLTSRWLLDEEVPALLERQEKEGVRVIPVILSPCPWTRIPWIRTIQAWPKDGEPLSGMTTHAAEAALAMLAADVAKWGGRRANSNSKSVTNQSRFSTSRTVYLSSTTIDLPEHRQKVIDACLKLNFRPVGMEHWPAADSTALEHCLRGVEECDVFIGIYSYRYGWTPPGETKSITELEYDHAVKLGKPRYLFMMGKDHLIRAKDKDNGAQLEALERFKARIGAERTWDTFNNSDQLKSGVLVALHDVGASLLAKQVSSEGQTPNREQARSYETRIDLSHLPSGAPHFLGREAELASLDAAWADNGNTSILQLIAPGGTGKTSLMTRWIDRLRADNWRGAAQVFGWSFYSQGSGEDRQASEDGFFEAALKFFGVDIAPTASPWDKGGALADAMAEQRNLLILDGLEPLQYPPTAKVLAGELKAPGLETLLRQLAANGQPGLVLVTSREHLTDLADRVRNEERPEAGVAVLDLGNLRDADGASLLHRLGVKRAGAAEIPSDDAELLAASRAVDGHALTLSLLGSYLARTNGGDVRQIAEVDFARANERTNKGHAFRAINSYETWFQREGENGAQELAALRLLGFFERSATKENLAALCARPAIPGLTEALIGLDEKYWRLILSKLQNAGLVEFDAKIGYLTAHPLVRAYMADTLKTQLPEAWREGHGRIYVQLKSSVPHRPEGLSGLQPLYQAVVHGCLAGLQQEVCDQVYLDRIQRSQEAYSTKKLGAFGADLGAVACFFEVPWRQVSKALSGATRAWLLNQAAFNLRALGRLEEALEPMQAGAEIALKQEDWKNAAIYYSNLSALQLSLGRITAAVNDARQSADYADRSGDAFARFSNRTTLADALHQHFEPAAELFAEAEGMQAELQPAYPLLYSLAGFRYCELLLAPAERAAWAKWGGPQAAKDGDDVSKAPVGASSNLQVCGEVAQRAAQTLEWATLNNEALLDSALDHLTLARSFLYADLLQSRAPGQEARIHAEQALAGLRKAGNQNHIPLGLLAQAWIRACLKDEAGARATLDEAERIASRGGMKLILADIALHRARLFRDHAELAKARALIMECEYFRRLPELEDAEKALAALSDEPRRGEAPRQYSPEDTLRLAFRLVLAGVAKPDLLRTFKPDLLTDALRQLKQTSKANNESIDWLKSAYPTNPNALWLAWACTVRKAEVALLQKELA